jgi:glycosyltransferase involved in cell wall biosynthesis
MEPKNIFISGCIIALNEERRIRNAIVSLKHFVDEVIVVDGGSIDRTVGVSRDIGAKVFTRKWKDDYGSQRNFAIDKSVGKWIFFLDADEQLIVHGKNNFQDLINANTNIDGFRINRSNFLDGKKTGSIADYDTQLRLFKRKGRYNRKIHEVPDNLNKIMILDKKICEIMHYKSRGIQRSHLIYQKKIMDDSLKILRRKTRLSRIDKNNLEFLEKMERNWNIWWTDATSQMYKNKK